MALRNSWYHARFNSFASIGVVRSEAAFWRAWLESNPSRAQGVATAYLPDFSRVHLPAARSLVRDLEELEAGMLLVLRRRVAARKILAQFRASISDPAYAMCQRRLRREAGELLLGV